ncbi:MAG: molybdopterin-dependent oxidoreductase [Acidobacteria bacterium]|nr:molybdopterin-dependent oxidoreductase [Acidobacteriota bacterium]
MGNRIAVTRREWLGAAGSGLALDVAVEGADGPLLKARFEFAKDGVVTLLTGKCELGQGCRTLLAQCVAEELGVPITRVRVVMADTDRVPDDGGTFASLTTPLAVPAIRRAAAAARDALRTMTPVQALQREIPPGVKVTAPAEWRVLGKNVPNLNGRDIVTGALRYAGDIKQEGVLYGRVLRPATYHGELSRAEGSGVLREGAIAGVAVTDGGSLDRAAGGIRAEWKSRDLIPAADLYDHFRKTGIAPTANDSARYPPLLVKGAAETALASAQRVHQASYTIPAIAHAPLEPRAAIASWDDKGLTIRSCGQVPFGVRKQVAAAFKLAEDRVRVVFLDTGGGFGGKHGPEVLIEAAALAKAAGKPVRVEWTREEEFTRSYCRPPGVIDIRSAITNDGRIAAWDFRNYNSGAASLAAPYDIPHHRCAFYRAECPLRTGPYRSLAAVANTFARETHVDELAALADADPLEFRLKNIANPRLREAIDRAATRFGWGKRKAAQGVACNVEKGGNLALFVELEVNGKRVRLLRMVAAFDCGAILNPEGLRNQVTGAMVMGIGGALFEELRFDRKKVLNPSFSTYRVPRFTDVPPFEVILIDRREETPAGAGESPITVVAPAIGAAIFQATGKRLRGLPLEKGLAG